MSKKELLEKDYESAYEAMHALEEFFKNFDPEKEKCTKGELQGLRVIGNKIYE